MADTPGAIDSLSIEIGASSNNAVNNINKLVNAMKALKDATSKIDNGAAGKLRDLASVLKDLGNAKKINISSKLGENIGALAGAMKAVKSEDISKLRQVASAVKTFDGVKNVNINSRLANNIVEVASAVSLLEKTHFEKLTQFGNALKALSGGNISISKTLSERLKEIAAAVDTISNDTLDKIRQLTKALARLKGMGDVKIRISGVGSASAGGNKGNNPLPGGTQKSGQSKTGGESDEVKKQIEWTLSLKKNISLVAAEWSTVGQAIASALGPLALVLSIVGGIVKCVWNVAKGIAKWAFNTALNALKKIWSVIKNIAKGAVNVGKNIAKYIYDHSIIKKAIDGYKRLQKAISSVGRIAFYRAIRSAIKYVTDALKEGTENAYWYSKKFGDATKYISEAYDQMSSSNFKMSNQLGAAWSTLIATIQPIIIQIIELVTKAAEAVTKFFAVLSGKTTYLHATDYAHAWAEETENGANAAKEWKNQLMGFDEINRLEAPSDTSSGGGRNDYTDYENMFEEADVGGIFKKIQELINSNEWGELGTLLGQKFNDLLDNIDWPGWGTKIGTWIQHGIDLANSFLDEKPFQKLGEKIAYFLNNLGDSVNFYNLGKLAMRISLALWDTLYHAIINIKWDQFAINLSRFIIGALDTLAVWISGLDTDKIAKAIKDFFGNIDYIGIRDSLVTLVSTAWTKAVELKDKIFDDETKEKIRKKICEIFGAEDWEDLKKTIRDKLSEAWKWATEKFDEIWPPEDREEFFKTIGSGFVNLGITIGEGIWNAFLETKFGKFIYAISQVEGVFLGLQNPVTATQKIVEAFKSASEETGNGVSNAFSDMKTSTTTNFNEVNTAADYSVSAFDDLASKSEKDMQSMSGNVSTKSSDISNSLQSEIVNSASDVANELGTMSATGSSEISNLQSSVSSSSSGIVSSLNWIISVAQNAWSWLQSVSSYANDMGVGINGAGLYGGGMSDFTGYATGGFPEDGLFFANHTELVGKFSNGKTAVANNEQIVSGIASGVYDAVVSAFQTAGGGNDKEISIYLDGKEIARTTTKYQRQYARAAG